MFLYESTIQILEKLTQQICLKTSQEIIQNVLSVYWLQAYITQNLAIPILFMDRILIFSPGTIFLWIYSRVNAN